MGLIFDNSDEIERREETFPSDGVFVSFDGVKTLVLGVFTTDRTDGHG